MCNNGIFSIGSFSVGLPGENEKMRENYIDAAVVLADSATFLPFQPFPGTLMARSTGEADQRP